MKMDMMPGEFAFKALVKAKHTTKDADGKVYSDSWGETTGFFLSLEEVQAYYNPDDWDIKWPIEVLDNGSIYIPAKEEYTETN